MKRETRLLSEEQRNDLGRGLLAWRLRVGKSQKAIAKDLGMSRFTIARAENNGDEVGEATLYRIYAYLVRQLNIERETANAIDAHIVEKSTEVGRIRFDEALKEDYDTWQLTK